jgi:hypothetical protein
MLQRKIVQNIFDLGLEKPKEEKILKQIQQIAKSKNPFSFVQNRKIHFVL